jgi:uncharacterized protein (DUF1778 family)
MSLVLAKLSYIAMPDAKKRRRSPLSFRCNRRDAVLLAQAAQAQGISRGRLIRVAALAAAAEVLGEYWPGT